MAYELQIKTARIDELRYLLGDTATNKVLLDRLADAESASEGFDEMEKDLLHIIEGSQSVLEEEGDKLAKLASKIRAGDIIPANDLIEFLEDASSELLEARDIADFEIKKYV